MLQLVKFSVLGNANGSSQLSKRTLNSIEKWLVNKFNIVHINSNTLDVIKPINNNNNSDK